MYTSQLLKRGWDHLITIIVIIAIVVIGIGVFYYLETTYRTITEEGVYKVEVTPHTGGNIEVKDNVVIAKPVKLGEGYSNSFRLKLHPTFNSKNTTIIMYVKILENPAGKDFDSLLVWPRGVIGQTDEVWYSFGFSLKVGTTYKITIEYPNIAYCEPEPLFGINTFEPEETETLSPRLIYLQFSTHSTIMIWNITVIVGKS